RREGGYGPRPDGRWQLDRFGADQEAFVWAAFRAKLAEMLADVPAWGDGNWNGQRVIDGDSLDRLGRFGAGSFDSVIFSPPYVNRFDYVESQKVELWLRGFVDSYDAMLALRNGSLRSRPHRRPRRPPRPRRRVRGGVGRARPASHRRPPAAHRAAGPGRVDAGERRDPVMTGGGARRRPDAVETIGFVEVEAFPPLAEIDHGQLFGLSLSTTTTAFTHGLHRFAAKYVPQVPAWALDTFAGRDSVVVDPFMGSGTTLVEGVLRGGTNIGVDIDPLARVIARAKATPVDHAPSRAP